MLGHSWCVLNVILVDGTNSSEVLIIIIVIGAVAGKIDHILLLRKQS